MVTIMNIFDKKIKGKVVGFVLGIKGRVPYPQKADRWKLFGSPLCAYVNPYYEKTQLNTSRMERVSS